jgi:hypothetical protein
MGWEMRWGKQVYYRKQRYRDAEGKSRVRSIYCGGGERGEVAAREDEGRRRGVSPAGDEPCATSAAPPDKQTVYRRSGDEGAGRPESLADLLQSNSGAVGAADTPAGTGRLEPAAPAVTARPRRYPPTADYLMRICGILPPRRKPPARPRYRRD